MNLIQIRTAGLVCLLASGLLFAGCGDSNGDADSGNPGNKDATVAGDTGIQGNKDATPGVDTGPAADSGPRDGGVTGCIQGSEGCPCTPQNGCATDLLCVEWPAESTTLPPQRTCVRPCDDDTTCAASTVGNASCSEFWLGDDPVTSDTIGIRAICTNSRVNAGQDCKGSRSGGAQMVGCAANLTCLTNLFRSGDNNDDVGACGQLCMVSTSTPTGGCTAPTPYCNPAGSGLAISATVSVGVCAVGVIKQGSRCGSDDVTKSCDTSADTIKPGNGHECIGFPDLPDSEGVCVEICELNGGSCGGTQPSAGTYACQRYSPNDNSAGLCASNCTNFPDSCAGAGAAAAGRVCQDVWGFARDLPISFCTDRGTPALAAATVGRDVNDHSRPSIGQYEDCRWGQGSEGDFYRCPEGTYCQLLGDANDAPAQGGCVYGCTTSTAALNSGCETVATATTCLPVAATSVEGICVGN